MKIVLICFVLLSLMDFSSVNALAPASQLQKLSERIHGKKEALIVNSDKPWMNPGIGGFSVDEKTNNLVKSVDMEKRNRALQGKSSSSLTQTELLLAKQAYLDFRKNDDWMKDVSIETKTVNPATVDREVYAMRGYSVLKKYEVRMKTEDQYKTVWDPNKNARVSFEFQNPNIIPMDEMLLVKNDRTGELKYIRIGSFDGGNHLNSETGFPGYSKESVEKFCQELIRQGYDPAIINDDRRMGAGGRDQMLCGYSTIVLMIYQSTGYKPSMDQVIRFYHYQKHNDPSFADQSQKNRDDLNRGSFGWSMSFSKQLVDPFLTQSGKDSRDFSLWNPLFEQHYQPNQYTTTEKKKLLCDQAGMTFVPNLKNALKKIDFDKTGGVIVGFRLYTYLISKIYDVETGKAKYVLYNPHNFDYEKDFYQKSFSSQRRNPNEKGLYYHDTLEGAMSSLGIFHPNENPIALSFYDREISNFLMKGFLDTRNRTEQEVIYGKQRRDHLKQEQSNEKAIAGKKNFTLLLDGTRLTEEERVQNGFDPGKMFLRKSIPLEKKQSLMSYIEKGLLRFRNNRPGSLTISAVKKKQKKDLILQTPWNVSMEAGDTAIMTIASRPTFKLKLDLSELSATEKRKLNYSSKINFADSDLTVEPGTKSLESYVYTQLKDKDLVSGFDTQITEFRKKNSNKNLSGILNKQFIEGGDSIVVRVLSKESKNEKPVSNMFSSKAFVRKKSQTKKSQTFKMNFNISGLSQADKLTMGFFPGQMFHSVDVPVENKNDISFYLANNANLYTHFNITNTILRKKNIDYIMSNEEMQIEKVEEGDSVMLSLKSKKGPDETFQTVFPSDRFRIHFDMSQLTSAEKTSLNIAMDQEISVKDENNIVFYLHKLNENLFKKYDLALTNFRSNAGGGVSGKLSEAILKKGDSMTVVLKSKTRQSPKQDQGTFKLHFNVSGLTQRERESLNIPLNQDIPVESNLTIRTHLEEKNLQLLKDYDIEISPLLRKGGRTSSQKGSQALLKDGDTITVFLQSKTRQSPKQDQGTFKLRFDVSGLTQRERESLNIPLNQDIPVESNLTIRTHLEEKNLQLLKDYDIEISPLLRKGGRTSSQKGSQALLKDGDTITVFLQSKTRQSPKQNQGTFKLRFDVSGLSQSEKDSLNISLNQDIPVESNMTIRTHLQKEKNWLENYDFDISSLLRKGGQTSSQKASQALLKDGDTITVFLQSKKRSQPQKSPDTFQIDFNLSQLSPKDQVELSSMEKNQRIILDGEQSIGEYLEKNFGVNNFELTKKYDIHIGFLEREGHQYSKGTSQAILNARDRVNVTLKSKKIPQKVSGTFQMHCDMSQLPSSEREKVSRLLQRNVRVEGEKTLSFYLLKNKDLAENYTFETISLRKYNEQNNFNGLPSKENLSEGDSIAIRIKPKQKSKQETPLSQREEIIASAKAEGKQVLQISIGSKENYYIKINLNNQGKKDLPQMLYGLFFNGRKDDASSKVRIDSIQRNNQLISGKQSQFQEETLLPGDLLRIQITSDSDNSLILAKSA